MLVARGASAYPMKLGLYLFLSEVAVEHELCGVVALLDHEPCALAQGHGVAHRVLVRVFGAIVKSRKAVRVRSSALRNPLI